MGDRGPSSALALVAVLAAAAITGCGQSGPRLPPDPAGPRDVVQAFLAAVAERDAAAVEALATPRHWAAIASTGWPSGVESVTDLRVGAARESRDSRRPGAVEVPVTFTIRWRAPDGAFPNGPATWGYVLTRATPESPWRIDDQGVG